MGIDGDGLGVLAWVTIILMTLSTGDAIRTSRSTHRMETDSISTSFTGEDLMSDLLGAP